MATARFTDNNNGTVTDKLTGLIWLKEGLCLKFFAEDTASTNQRPWAEAINSANKLANSSCGLSDGSKAGDWRLPNVNELSSLIDRSQLDPALPAGCPLAASTVSSDYWSATTLANSPAYAWYVFFNDGYDYWNNKTNSYYVRCVRAGL